MISFNHFSPISIGVVWNLSTPQSIASYLRDLIEFSQYFGSVPNTCLSGTKEARKRSAKEEVTRFVFRDIYASKAKI